MKTKTIEEVVEFLKKELKTNLEEDNEVRNQRYSSRYELGLVDGKGVSLQRVLDFINPGE